MPTLTADADAANLNFSGNRLLKLFDEEMRERLRGHASYVRLEIGDILFSTGENVDHTYFPYAPTMVSLIVELDDNRRVEVASIGQEGAIGGIVSCGDLPAFTRAEVQVAGGAMRLPLGVLDEVKREHSLLREVYCRYSDYLLAQVMQSVACSSFHSIEERAARWLLTAQDRAGDRLELTQEALASLLGVQRTTVNAVARQLQQEGLIEYRRGKVEVTDREALLARTCDCYARVEEHYGAVIGAGDLPWMENCED